jgi:excisionase family DNA binding protein
MMPPAESALAEAIVAALDDAALDQLADRLVSRIEARLQREDRTTPWLSAESAARYLACSRGRLYDLVQLGKVEPYRDGRRLLFRRGDLDAYVESGT